MHAASLVSPTVSLGSLLAVAAALPHLGARLPAQGCSGQGSMPVAASVEPAPVALGCAGAAAWPQWHLFTPAHRAPAAHAGFDPGGATAKPRLLVAYRCTGFLLVPVLPASVAVMGYVIDRAEHACPPVTS